MKLMMLFSTLTFFTTNAVFARELSETFLLKLEEKRELSPAAAAEPDKEQDLSDCDKVTAACETSSCEGNC